MNNIPNIILFDLIKISCTKFGTLQKKIIYIPYGDGEQTYSIFVDNLYPFNSVCKKWNIVIEKLLA